MANDIERNLGEQPVAAIMRELRLNPKDLVSASPAQITFKMVSRACKGRRLTSRVQLKIRAALNTAAQRDFSVSDLFNY
ncbi:MAG: hypothetical protein RRC34_12060 [Lentisphaeria bacterium]|nr:hypothetical protein [Lentisphaeria bacterium]